MDEEDENPTPAKLEQIRRAKWVHLHPVISENQKDRDCPQDIQIRVLPGLVVLWHVYEKKGRFSQFNRQNRPPTATARSSHSGFVSPSMGKPSMPLTAPDKTRANTRRV
jgi:hypothetical protein